VRVHVAPPFRFGGGLGDHRELKSSMETQDTWLV
jgi:hypothetical protein